MICPVCHKREATQDVVRYFGEYKTQGKVCSFCYEKALNLDANGFYNTFYADLQKSCRRCGRTLNQILNTMIVGCPHCYTQFATELGPLIKSVQSSEDDDWYCNFHKNSFGKKLC